MSKKQVPENSLKPSLLKKVWFKLLILISVVVGFVAGFIIIDNSGGHRRCFDCSSKADLYNVYLACKSYWADEGSNQLCKLESIPAEKYGYVQSKGVHLKMSGNKLDFLAKASHLESKNIFEIDAKGNITESNPVASDSFHQAILMSYWRDFSKLRDWINRSENINKPDDFNRYPIHFASSGLRYRWSGQTPLVQLLVEKGANVNVTDVSGNTPLHMAVKERNKTGVKFLLEQGADVNVANVWGYTPLHLAAKFRVIMDAAYKKRNESLVSILLENGSDVNVANVSGNTPLHTSIILKNEPLANTLLEHDADVNVADKKGITPLHLAVRAENESLVKTLLEHDADVNIAGVWGNTPLHWAAGTENVSLVNLLIGHGADVNVANKKGYTPLHIAAIKENESLVNILLEHSANAKVKSN